MKNWIRRKIILFLEISFGEFALYLLLVYMNLIPQINILLEDKIGLSKIIFSIILINIILAFFVDFVISLMRKISNFLN